MDTARLLALLDQAVGLGWVTTSERDRLRFTAAAEHAQAVGDANPAGLLVRVVRDGLWQVIGLEDEDRARRRLRAYDRGQIATDATPKKGMGEPCETAQDVVNVILERLRT